MEIPVRSDISLAKKKRLDVLVYEAGLAESREKAKALIMAGVIYVDNQKSDKPGTDYPETVNIELRGSKLKYASRGGLKLEKALQVFPIDLSGCTAMDIGASHGGFTDCMLQNGARKVYAVDVGYGQLVWKLRNDERVVNLENTNIRYITKEQVPDILDFFSVDVSFISLELVLPAARPLLRDDGTAVCLIKPQFEAGREKVGKNGVVRDKKVHTEVIEKIVSFCLNNGFSVIDLDYSPVKGPAGNIEYLAYICKAGEPKAYKAFDIAGLVEKSHTELDK